MVTRLQVVRTAQPLPCGAHGPGHQNGIRADLISNDALNVVAFCAAKCTFILLTPVARLNLLREKVSISQTQTQIRFPFYCVL